MVQLQDNLEKQPTKVEMQKKVEAWKRLNSVLVQANAEFMNKLKSILTEKTVQHSQVQEVLEKGEGTDELGAEYLYLGGYIQCLKDILGIKPKAD